MCHLCCGPRWPRFRPCRRSNLAALGFSAAELADSFGWHRKALLDSTPAIAGRSRIEREDLTSDQRRFFVPCSACGGIPRLRFEPQLREKGAPETARYHCDAHGHSMQEHGKAPDWKRQVGRREDFAPGPVPAGALVLTAGVDVQNDRIAGDIWGW